MKRGRQVRIGKEYGEIYDHHVVEFEYADGTRMFSQCRQIPGTRDSVTEAFHGTRGSAPEPGKIVDAKGKVLMAHDSKNDPNPYQVEHDELFASIRNGKPINNGDYMTKTTLMAIMGRMATYTGQKITWEQGMNSQENLSPESYDWNAKPPKSEVPIPGVTKFI